jgi:tRNA(Ile)-lysidine synthase
LTEVVDRVWRTIECNALLCPNDRVVLGVSGGPDSVCMLHVLLGLRERLPLQLTVAHLNHGARGGDSDADAEFVASLAAQYGLPHVIERQDVPALAREQRLAFEEAARRARYAFLARVAQQVGASKVAVAHTADDQAETVLMHFLRGSGLAGLRGMLPLTPLTDYRLLGPFGASMATQGERACAPASGLAIVRPLLETPRADIERYCAQHALPTRFDRSNLDTTFFRNRLRHELLPLLATYNPAIRARLCHTAQVLAADYELLARLRDEAWAAIVREADERAIVFDLSAWRALPVSLQRATLRQAGFQLRPGLRDLDFVHVENARLVALNGRVGAQATLPQGLALRVGYNVLRIAQSGETEGLPEQPLLWSSEPVMVALPGLTPLPSSAWVLEATRLSSWSIHEVAANPDPWTAYMDAEALAGSLTLRTRRAGDRFCPQGMGGHRVGLSAFLINLKVPRAWRDRLPLLEANGTIVWVCGYRIAEAAAVGHSTRHVARLRFLRLE